MKTIIVALIFVLFAKTSVAQKELLSFDEHNKYIYYQVVDITGEPIDTLNERGVNFLKSIKPKVKIGSAIKANSLTAQGVFETVGGVSLLKRPNGQITYTITIECKDQKYRYWLTGFVFTPYVRDRYGNFVPEQGVEIPLEGTSSKLERKDLDSYLAQTGAFCKDLGEKLKVFMLKISTVKKEGEPKKISIKEW